MEGRMKLKADFMTHNSEGEQILIDVSNHFSGLIRNNRTAAFIVDCLKRDVSEEEIVDCVYREYDASRDVIREDVKRVIEKLRTIGAIDE